MFAVFNPSKTVLLAGEFDEIMRFMIACDVFFIKHSRMSRFKFISFHWADQLRRRWGQ